MRFCLMHFSYPTKRERKKNNNKYLQQIDDVDAFSHALHTFNQVFFQLMLTRFIA